MCIDQVLIPYWESLTLLLKCHCVKIKVWVSRGVAESIMWVISGSHLQQCLSPLLPGRHCFTPACEGPEQYENDYWETVESHLLFSSFPSFLHPTSFHEPKPKTVSGGRSFPHNPEHKIPSYHLPGSLTLKSSPPLKPHAFLTLLNIVQTSILVFFQTNNEAFSTPSGFNILLFCFMRSLNPRLNQGGL